MKLVRKNKGFTLLELLVTIAIMGILVSIVGANFKAPQQRARDARRKSDLKQYSTSLESFANLNNGLYASYTTAIDAATGGLCTRLGEINCPDDPLLTTSPSYLHYRYISNGSGAAGSATATSYVLWGQLESGTGGYWIVCSTGKLGSSATSPTTSTCPI